MDEKSMLPRLVWNAREVRRIIGLPGAVGAAMLAAALLFYAVAVLPVAAESAALAREITALEAARQAAPADGTREKPSDPVRQLAEFYRFFPKSSQAPDDLAKLHELAAVHQVQLDQGTYRLVRDRVGKLLMYEIALPVKGDYPQLRKFMSQALTEIPYLSLDSVSFQRQKASDTTLESQIKFTLFLVEAP
ncbi:hypothetical protein [Polaromonas sp. YR568]|uniref:hypothetical protein n=1 Tax=Polaromonas sp. YR568 TaxID=1855301 RepID=UPI00398BC88B